MITTSNAGQIIEAEGIYLDEYEKIVKPNQLFLIPNYFIHYWVRRLGVALAWIVVALQQACWRASDDRCSLPQTEIAEEIGLERHTVSRILKENAWRHWYIPQIEYQRGHIDQEGIYYPLPRKYQIYLSTPLIPEHLAGLYLYFQEKCPLPTTDSVEQALDALLTLDSKAALALLESYTIETAPKFTAPLHPKDVLEMATGFKLDSLSQAAAQALQKKLSKTYSHLTDIGKTACRQYFRLNWVPRLGPALAWLVMVLRTRCFYNPDTGELRNTYTWPKKDLVAALGQSRNNLPNLLSGTYVEHFIKILNQQKHKLTVQVEMVIEPIIPEVDLVAISTLSENAQKSTMTPPENAQKSTMTLPENAQKSTMTPEERTKIYHDPLENAQNYATYKYFKESVLNVVEEKKDSIQENNAAAKTNSKDNLKEMLIAAGLTGRGLDNLLNQSASPDPIKTRAVILYAQVKNLGPGYIYRCLESDAPVDDLFLQIAALDEETLSLFWQATSELKANGGLSLTLPTPIPAEWVDLFIQFAEVFAGLEAGYVAALFHPGRVSSPVIDLPPGEKAAGDELALFWEQVLNHLRSQMTRDTFDTWLKGTRLVARDGSHFTVAVKSIFAKDWLENRLFVIIQRTLANLLKEDDQESLELDIQIDFVLPSMTAG